VGLVYAFAAEHRQVDQSTFSVEKLDGLRDARQLLDWDGAAAARSQSGTHRGPIPKEIFVPTIY
jgi:hypothetical protein